MHPVAPEGFPNWSQLFEYLKAHGFADQQRVALVYPATDENADTVSNTETPPLVKPAAREVELYIDEIKARAFEEMYDRLPTRESISLMNDMLETAAKFVGVKSHVYPIKEFLNKLATRNE